MATTWPIVKTQRSMPGETGGTRGSLDYPDDAIRGWREFQKLWDDAGNEWNKRRLKQIDSQITEYKVRYTEEVEKFSASLDKNQDESTYPAELEKFQSNTQTFLPKDPIASAAAKLYARGKVPFHQKTIRMLQDAKLEDKWFAGIGALEVRVRDGDASLPEYEVENRKGVALGHITRTAAEENVRKLTDNVEYDRMMAYSKSKEGSQKVLETYSAEGGTIKIGVFPDLKDPGKVMVMKNLAMGAIGEEERIKELLITGSNQSMSKDAIDFSISPVQKWKEIQQLDTGDNEKIALFDKFVKARQKIVAGLGDPFNKTTDEIVRKDMMERARSKTLTYKEINDAEGVSISTPDADKMRKTLEDKDDKSKSFQESEAGKNLTALIDDTIEDDVALNQFAQQKGLSILRSAIENNPDWTLREKKEEALRVGRRIEQDYDDGLLEQELERTLLVKPEIFSKLTPGKFAEPGKKGITKGDFGKRPDGTKKGNGFLGVLQLPNGGVATEYSVGVQLESRGGKETDIPSLVPTLTPEEISLMVNDIIPNDKPVPKDILQKAVDHANMRVREGKSVFAQEGEQLKSRKKGIPQPKTKAEYEALPKGATYIHPTLGRVVKQ